MAIDRERRQRRVDRSERSGRLLREKRVGYMNKDFVSLKKDLIAFSQAHHSGVFQDFNESSPGMALLELCAYVGDVLSFHQDMQFIELRSESARQIENVDANAKMLGYRPAGKRAARGVESFFIEVPATLNNGVLVPDSNYCPILRKSARVQGPNGAFFETLDDIHFSASSIDSPRMVTGSKFDSTTGLPTHFGIRKDVEVVAGQTVEDTFTITSFEQFKTIELSREDVIEVLGVVDSDGNTWTEVDYLAQEMVYDYVQNVGDDSDVVPYVMKLVTVPRRFVTQRDPVTNKTKLVFGSGDGVNFDDQIIPNLADLALPLAGRRTFSTFALDPQNFLKTRSLGLSPFNTTLTVTYRVGGGDHTNAAPFTVDSVSEADLEFADTSLDPLVKAAVEGSLECTNYARMEGGGPEETISEIRANSAAFFAAQNRVVTREDYIARVKSLPAKFGKPEKVYVKPSRAGTSLDLHILAKDSHGHLTLAGSTLKQNIRTYLSPYRMITDGINILDSNIINLRCHFGVVVSPKLSRTEVLANCLDVVREYLHVDRMEIGQPIIVSELQAELQSVYGVISVYELKFTNVIGTTEGMTYSSTRFDPQGNRRNEILYCPENSIFEIKYPTRDIIGASK